MTWEGAQQVCTRMGRALPQPRSQDENGFYANFIKGLLEGQPEVRNQKDMKVKTKTLLLYSIGIS